MVASGLIMLAAAAAASSRIVSDCCCWLLASPGLATGTGCWLVEACLLAATVGQIVAAGVLAAGLLLLGWLAGCCSWQLAAGRWFVDACCRCLLPHSPFHSSAFPFLAFPCGLSSNLRIRAAAK